MKMTTTPAIPVTEMERNEHSKRGRIMSWLQLGTMRRANLFALLLTLVMLAAIACDAV